jgi:hypothetical protein
MRRRTAVSVIALALGATTLMAEASAEEPTLIKRLNTQRWLPTGT